MNTKQILLSILISISAMLNAQWSQKASLPGTPRAKAASFTIGNKIYLVGGIDAFDNVLNDVWEYDISNNSWAQLANFPGGARCSATAFAINNLGYVTTGDLGGIGYTDDIWEYHPIGDWWVQKAPMPFNPSNQRREAISFTIGNKAYVGCGEGFVLGPNSTTNYAFFDLWEFDPATNIWIQKADIPSFIGRTMGIGVSINNKGYVGLGSNVDQNINYKTFWEYDPSNDTWTAKANYPSNWSADCGAITWNNNIYVVGGVNLSNIALTNAFYKYDIANNTWSQLLGFNGQAIAGEFAISTGTTAFVGTGYTGAINPRADLWKIENDTTTIHVNFQMKSGMICNGSTLTFTNTTTNPAGVIFHWNVQPSNGISFVNGAIVPSPQIGFANPGTYTINCVASNSVGSVTKTQTVTITNCNALVDNVVTNTLELFPNPTNGRVSIVPSGSLNKKVTLCVVNGLGQLMKEIKDIDFSADKIEIDLSDLKSGLYTISGVFDGIYLSKRVLLHKD